MPDRSVFRKQFSADGKKGFYGENCAVCKDDPVSVRIDLFDFAAKGHVGSAGFLLIRLKIGEFTFRL